MRESDARTGSLFSYVGIEAQLRPDQRLRAIRSLTETIVRGRPRSASSAVNSRTTCLPKIDVSAT